MTHPPFLCFNLARSPLALGARCFPAANIARKSSTYRWERHDKVVELGLLCSGNDLIHADFPHVVTILDVLSDAAVEQHGLLGHDANLGPQEGHVDTGGVVAINQLQGAIDFAIRRKQHKNQRVLMQST